MTIKEKPLNLREQVERQRARSIERMSSHPPAPAEPAPPEPGLWDGSYEKEFYWLSPPEGGARVMCWPNAGLMNATDGSDRAWKPEDGVRVEKITLEEELPRMRARHPAPRPAPLGSQPPGDPVRDRAARKTSVVVLGLSSDEEGTRWLHTRNMKSGRCTHRFGLAGGFSECSACGIKERRSL